jgi:uncharacterized protein YkwD
MRTRLTLAVVSLFGFFGAAAAVAPVAHAESTGSAFSSRLVQLVNAARADYGLRPLAVASGTSAVAAGWTEHLAAAQSLSHNPNLATQLESHGSPDWTSYGENVGMGPTTSARTLFNAYMNSPEHRANILGASYRYLGISVVYTGSKAWNTMDFVDRYSSPTQTVTQTSAVRQATTVRQTTTVRRVTPKVALRSHVAPRRSTTRHAAPADPVRATVKAVASTLPVDGPPEEVHNTALAAPTLPTPVSHSHFRIAALPIAAAIWLLVLGVARLLVIRRLRAS